MPITRPSGTRGPAGRRVVTLAGLTAVLAGAVPTAAAAPATAPAADGARAYTDDGAHAVHYLGGAAGNDVVVTGGDGGTRFVIDDVVPIEAAAGCEHPNEGDDTRVVCRLTEFGDFWTRVVVDLGDGNDAVDLRAGDENEVAGGPGDDLVHTTPNSVVDGGAGDDWLDGGFLSHGGPGDDTILGLLDGGHAFGDDGDDVIHGGPGGEELRGGRGHDLIEAAGGPDVVYGNSGEDTIRGGRGDDELSGGPDDDTIHGNSGDDVLRGGGGDDRLSGGPGTDVVVG